MSSCSQSLPKLSGKQQHCTTRLATVQYRFVPNSAFVGRTGQARQKTSEHPQHSLAIANSIAGRVGEHPNEKDQRTGELHAKENQGGDKCERGDTPDTDSL